MPRRTAHRSRRCATGSRTSADPESSTRTTRARARRRPRSRCPTSPSPHEDLAAPTRIGTGSRPAAGAVRAGALVRRVGRAGRRHRRPRPTTPGRGAVDGPAAPDPRAAGRHHRVRHGDYGPTARERAPAGERLRRSVTLLAVGGVVAGAITFAPYVALAVLFVVRLAAAQRLDGGSLGRQPPQPPRGQVVRRHPGAARRPVARRGRRSAARCCSSCGAWASPPRSPCSASQRRSRCRPRSAVIGVSFAVGLWWGPGSERLRSPIHRVVDPLARRACRGCSSRSSSPPVPPGSERPPRRRAPRGRRTTRRRSATYASRAGSDPGGGAQQPAGAVGQAPQAAHGQRGPRPGRRAVGGAPVRVGRLRLLRQHRRPAPARLRAPDLARWALHARPTWCRHAGPATPASATTRSPAGCVARSSTSGPSWSARRDPGRPACRRAGCAVPQPDRTSPQGSSAGPGRGVYGSPPTALEGVPMSPQHHPPRPPSRRDRSPH